jgi:hypothetical protein
MTDTTPAPDFPDPNTGARPATDPDAMPPEPAEERPLDDAGDPVPDTD